MRIIFILMLFVSSVKADYIIFSKPSTDDNVTDFEAIVLKLNSRLGYPNKEGTERYADPIVHPTEDMIAIKIIGNVKDLHLSDDEKVEVIKDLDATWDSATVVDDTSKIPDKKS